MRPCIDILGILESSNTIQTSSLSMAYCIEISAILQYLTPAISYHMLANQRTLTVQVQSIRHQNRQVFQISHQQAACILRSSRDQYIHGLLLHISFLATSALERNITIVGTMKQDRKDIPKE